MEARNQTSEEYVHIARFYPLESNSDAVLKVEYLTGRVSLTNPTDESSKAILTFNKIQCVDDNEYICGITYESNEVTHNKYTSSTLVLLLQVSNLSI